MNLAGSVEGTPSIAFLTSIMSSNILRALSPFAPPPNISLILSFPCLLSIPNFLTNLSISKDPKS